MNPVNSAKCMNNIVGKMLDATSRLQFGISTLPILSLLSSKAQGRKDFQKTSKSGQACIHWIALAENSQMSTHLPGFLSFFRFFAN